MSNTLSQSYRSQMWNVIERTSNQSLLVVTCPVDSGGIDAYQSRWLLTWQSVWPFSVLRHPDSAVPLFCQVLQGFSTLALLHVGLEKNSSFGGDVLCICRVYSGISGLCPLDARSTNPLKFYWSKVSSRHCQIFPGVQITQTHHCELFSFSRRVWIILCVCGYVFFPKLKFFLFWDPVNEILLSFFSFPATI